MERDREKIGDLESDVSSEAFDKVDELLFGGVTVAAGSHGSPSPECWNRRESPIAERRSVWGFCREKKEWMLESQTQTDYFFASTTAISCRQSLPICSKFLNLTFVVWDNYQISCSHFSFIYWKWNVLN